MNKSSILDHESFLNEKFHVELSQDQIQKLDGYSRILLEENKRVNLTGYKDLKTLLEKGILDSMLPILGIRREKIPIWVDVGSGGGLPGIPLSILLPQRRFFLLDARAKKVEALEKFIEQLGLENVEAVWGRLEDPELFSEWKEIYGSSPVGLIAKGVGPWPKLSHWMKGSSLKFEKACLLKGPNWEKEWSALAKDVTLSTLAKEAPKVTSITLPLSGQESFLLEIKCLK
jgi:16S rRNA (guanine(527)-N(7))-methyltransferase RsmG